MELLPYSVKLNEGKDYVIFKHEGDLTIATLGMARKDIRQLLRPIKTNKILVDVLVRSIIKEGYYEPI